MVSGAGVRGDAPAEILEMCSGDVPVLEMVTDMGVLASPWVMMGKVTEVGMNFSIGPFVGEAMPEPVRVARCGLPAALSVKERVA